MEQDVLQADLLLCNRINSLVIGKAKIWASVRLVPKCRLVGRNSATILKNAFDEHRLEIRREKRYGEFGWLFPCHRVFIINNL